MGHLTNPISLRLGKKVWWKHQYNSLSKRIHENFFFFLQIFFDRFLSSFFSRKKRYEFQGTLYFGNRLRIAQKIYLYIFLYDQKSEKVSSRFFAPYSKSYISLKNRWKRKLKLFQGFCSKYFGDPKEWEKQRKKALAKKKAEAAKKAKEEALRKSIAEAKAKVNAERLREYREERRAKMEAQRLFELQEVEKAKEEALAKINAQRLLELQEEEKAKKEALEKINAQRLLELQEEEKAKKESLAKINAQRLSEYREERKLLAEARKKENWKPWQVKKRYYHWSKQEKQKNREPNKKNFYGKKKKKIFLLKEEKKKKRVKNIKNTSILQTFLSFFLRRILPFKGKKFLKRFFQSEKFRGRYFKEVQFFRPLYFRVVLRAAFNVKMRKMLSSFYVWFGLKGSLYKILEKYFRDRNKVEVIFLCLRTKERGNPIDSLLITPKFLGEFITRKLDQRHKLRDVIHPVMKSLGKNPGIAGFKITCSGRFTRADRATYQWYKHGKISLNTVGLPILYDFTEKSLKFGMVSLKIWLQYREEKVKEYASKLEEYVSIR